jgi:uncharacterized membrane protein YhaH (DUF805 family)
VLKLWQNFKRIFNIMTFTEAIQAVFKKYAVFSGRSRRSEYWYWTLFTLIASIAASIIDTTAFGSNSYGPLGIILSLATLIPSLAVGIRRLHDVDRSGWWILIDFTIIGIIPLIYWYCQPGTNGDNRFGPPAPTKP